MFDIVLTGGRVIDGTGAPAVDTDVAIERGRITALGVLAQAESRQRIDVTGKVVCPGFIDAHVHGDLAVLADPLHEPAIRQGVTTYILGQDGVAMAPGSAATLEHMRRYTAGFSGTFPIEERWTSMAEYLSCFERKSAVNVACLIPNGNIRMEVMGLDTRSPTGDELRRMGRLVREAMEQGAVGLSSGLDYIPSRYASTEELIALCRETAPYGGVYVTHMRRYDADGVLASIDEVYRIGREAGVPVHISHFNSRAELALPKLDAGLASGLDVTFDLYCYLAGSSILGMVVLPPEVQEGGVAATVGRLRDPAVRSRLRAWFAGPKVPLEIVKISFVNNAADRHYEGLTLVQAFEKAAMSKDGTPPADVGAFVCDLLVASDMAVGCVVPHLNRTQEDVRQLMRHSSMMAGSDGIFTGSCPHPRGCGCFARYLGHHVRGDHTWSLEQAVHHLSACAARRFRLRDRGLIRPNMAADVVVFDPDTIADHSTYDEGRRLAVGVEHVAVNGELVLKDGKRTAALPGRALRPN